MVSRVECVIGIAFLLAGCRSSGPLPPLPEVSTASFLPSIRQAVDEAISGAKAHPNDAGAGASDYLRLMGITMLALMWGRSAKVSLGKDDKLHKDKLMCARYWMERMVPECPMLLERIQAGSAAIMELE